MTRRSPISRRNVCANSYIIGRVRSYFVALNVPADDKIAIYYYCGATIYTIPQFLAGFEFVLCLTRRFNKYKKR